MLYTRRDLGKLALAAGAASPLVAAKPDSNFGGVQIGAITYSFRALPSSADGSAEILPRLRHRRDRVDEQRRRELCRFAPAGRPRARAVRAVPVRDAGAGR